MKDRQEIDCNCNDCLFFERSISTRQKSVDLHYRWQKEEFDRNRMRLIEKAEYWIKRGENDKGKDLLKEARKMKFLFDESECALHYGLCSKFGKSVSFIPETLQFDTQSCFEHRIR